MAKGEIFKAGDRVIYNGGGVGFFSSVCTKGREYVLIDIGGFLIATGDLGQPIYINSDDFDLAPSKISAAPIVIGDMVRLNASLGAYAVGLSTWKTYEVKSVLTGNQSGNITAEYLIQDDTGQTNWFSSTLFEKAPATNPTAVAFKSLALTASDDPDPYVPYVKTVKNVVRCTCVMRDLMMNGCKCGALESERKSKV